MMAIGISEIWKEDVWTKYLTYAGKIMGLAAYGNIHHEWIEPMKTFYYQLATVERLSILGATIGLDGLHQINTFSGQTSYDIAATNQHVFEQVSLSAMLPYIERYQLPVILTGGAALNVLLNQRFKADDKFANIRSRKP
jgi:predicted NodU family carbamoyl transferase